MELKQMMTWGTAIAAVVTGTIAVNSYITPRSVHDEDLQYVMNTTSSYLLDLRIEQAEERLWRLKDQQRQGNLTIDQQIQLEKVQEQLRQLYRKKEDSQ